MRWPCRFAVLALTLAAGGCALFAPPPPKLTLTRATYAELPDWPLDDHASALAAFKTSCDAILKRQPRESVGAGLLAAPAARWQETCTQAMAVSAADARPFFERAFTPYHAENRGDRQGLFTGYYEPLLHGSRTRHGPYRHAVYAPPPELAADPYLTRAQIEDGALRHRRLELAYVDDPIALFFLHIQGSGRIALDDGSTMLVGYAGKNNQPYVTLGKVMRDEGLLEKDNVSMFSIRDWLLRHPDRACAMMNRNPSYVFFKELSGGEVRGAQGVELTPQRSLAVDARFLPYGLPVYLQTDLPMTALTPAHRFNQLMIAQDTGGAIRGPVRGDIFFGPGPEAEALAGLMKSKGRYTLLIPNPIAQGL
jgi:membrane-bound lytic murein transglycosylase A